MPVPGGWYHADDILPWRVLLDEDVALLEPTPEAAIEAARRLWGCE